jgi:hypothetical protein
MGIGSQSYNDGYNGNVLNTGGNFADFNNGQFDREREMRGGGGGGGGLGAIILALLVIPLAVISGVASLVISLFLLLFLSVFFSQGEKLSFSQAYGAAFFTSLVFQVITFIVIIIAGWLLQHPPAFVSSNYYVYNFLNHIDVSYSHLRIGITALFIILVPGILLSTFTLKKKLNKYFFNPVGYFRSLLINIIFIIPFILITYYCYYFFVLHYLAQLNTRHINHHY